MRDQLIKLYVDDAEVEMVKKMAASVNLPVNRFLRNLLAKYANTMFPYHTAQRFNRIYTRRYESN